MPKFLTQNEIYRILQRELPEGVYADGSPEAFFTTADSFATASGIATAYSKLERVYDNYFVNHADESIVDWELFAFGAEQSLPTLAERRVKIGNQLKSQPTIALWEILTSVANFVPAGTFVQIKELGCDPTVYGWQLGVSELGTESVLGWGYNKIGVDGGDLCAAMIGTGWRLGERELGVDTELTGDMSYADITAAQIRAYAYDVRIFGYTLSADEYAQLKALLRRKEPARSSNFLFDSLSLTTFGLTVPVTEVDQFDLVDCIAVDGTQTTGYSGRKTA